MTPFVHQITAYSPALEEAFARLMPQLSPRLGGVDRLRIEQILSSEYTALFSAEDGGRIVGLLTLVWYDVPSGRKAWVEDVVVDAEARGCGAGRALVAAAEERSAQIGAAKLMLTSSAHRTAARALYRKLGFEEAPTTVFAYNNKQ